MNQGRMEIGPTGLKIYLVVPSSFKGEGRSSDIFTDVSPEA